MTRVQCERIGIALILLFLLSPCCVIGTSPTLTFTTPTTFTIDADVKDSSADYFNIGSPLTFALNSVQSPRLRLVRGVSYTFISKTGSNHPFYLTSDSVGVGNGHRYTVPILQSNGQVVWQADPNGIGPLKLYYQCGLHPNMGNTITVIDPPNTPRPAGVSLCDWYTYMNGGDPSQVADEVAFLRALMTRALVGSSSTTPTVEGVIHNPLIAPYFSSMSTPGPARDHHITILIGFVGQSHLAACTAAGFPAYTGARDLRAFHSSFPTNQSMFDAFNRQAFTSALSFGFSAGDAHALSDSSWALRIGNTAIHTTICNQPDCACAPGWSGSNCEIGDRPPTLTLCDFYTGAMMKDTSSAEDEKELIRTVVMRVLYGSNTTTPIIPGASHDPLLEPFFHALNSDPIRLAYHIERNIEFIGSRFGCTAPDYPAYTGMTMRAAHASLNITYAVYGAFIDQLMLTLTSMNFTETDKTLVRANLNGFLRAGDPSDTMQICNQPDCPCQPDYNGTMCDESIAAGSSSTGNSGPGDSSTGGSGMPMCEIKTPMFVLQLLPEYRLQWSVHSSDQPSIDSNSNRRLLAAPASDEPPLYITLTLSGYGVEPGMSGYLGLGFGTTMVDTDVILCFLDSESKPVCIDSYTESFNPKPDDVYEDGHNDIKNVSVVIREDGLAIFTFQRLLNTGDPYDHVIEHPQITNTTTFDQLDQYQTNIIFSHGPSSTNGFEHHGLNNRGRGSVNFFTGQAQTSSDDNQRMARLVHGLTMMVTWLILYPFGAFTARYLKHWSHWIRVHESCQTCGSVGAVTFALMQLINVRTHFMTAHSSLGLAITLALIWQIVMGEFSKWRLSASESRWWHRPLAKAHKYLGIFLVTVGPYQVSLGIDLQWPDSPIARNLYWALVGIVISVFVTAESYKRFNAYVHKRRTAKYFVSHSSIDALADLDESHSQTHPALKMLPPDQFKSLPSMTWSDVSARVKSGSKLLVISGIVLDVRPFLNVHPGGKTILSDALGSDATEAFFGLDPDAPLTHAHTSFAWGRLREMSVAILKAETATELLSNRRSIDMDQVSPQLRKMRRLNQLLQDRRMPSDTPVGEAAHYRRYRLIAKEWITKSSMKLTFEQVMGVHTRPFVWNQYFTHSNDVRVSVPTPPFSVDASVGPTLVTRAIVGLTNMVVGNQRARIAGSPYQASTSVKRLTTSDSMNDPRGEIKPQRSNETNRQSGEFAPIPSSLQQLEMSVSPHHTLSLDDVNDVDLTTSSPSLPAQAQLRRRMMNDTSVLSSSAPVTTNLFGPSPASPSNRSRVHYLQPGDHLEMQVLIQS